MPGSNCETWKQICDDLGSNVQYSAGPVLTLNGQITASDYVDILGSQVHPIVQVLFPNNDAIFKDNDSPCPQPEVVILVFRSMKMHFNIFSASTVAQLKYHQTTVVSFRKQGDKEIPYHLSSNQKTSGTLFHQRLFTTYMNLFQKGYMLCYRQMLAQLHINKEICIFHSCFHYFCPSPVHVTKLYSLG